MSIIPTTNANGQPPVSEAEQFGQMIEEVIEEVRRVYPNVHTTLSLKELLDPAEKKRAKGVPRPQNCFMLFRKDIRAKFSREGHGLSVAESSRVAADSWRDLPQEKKNFWHALYEVVKMQHAVKYPNYKYQPIRNKHPKKGRAGKAERSGTIVFSANEKSLNGYEREV
ncbi:8519_t:CDS:1 [Paraglomus brasilianum]|uniref:8519_t:CDS:1 n=1 Tax=Paraglomus brasilianum TaxID=144538 RepID=A0A9N8WJD9_9GLOM|nr:8519_t:CDS:1 [Paraglomus brasilianum]